MRGVGVMSMSSKSFITSSALMVGGVERTAGNDAHHSCDLVSGSIMMFYVELWLYGNWLGGQYLFRVRTLGSRAKAALPRSDS